jgi:hypothetical protein
MIEGHEVMKELIRLLSVEGQPTKAVLGLPRTTWRTAVDHPWSVDHSFIITGLDVYRRNSIYMIVTFLANGAKGIVLIQTYLFNRFGVKRF